MRKALTYLTGETSKMANGNPVPPEGARLLSPIDLLDKARKEVPAVNYALGAVGVAAAGAIVTGLLGRGQATVIILGGMFVAMLLLFTFAQLIGASSRSIIMAGIVLLWSVTLFFCIFLVFIVTAFAFGQPYAIVKLLAITPSPSPDIVSPEGISEAKRFGKSIRSVILSIRSRKTPKA